MGREHRFTPLSELPDTVRVSIEVPRGARIKRAADGTIDFVSPMASPFNYGSVHGRLGADGEPVDAIVLDDATLAVGHDGTWAVHGVVDFEDEGLVDEKWICGARPPSLADLARIEQFFRRYARVKGLWSRVRRRGAVRFDGVRLRRPSAP